MDPRGINVDLRLPPELARAFERVELAAARAADAFADLRSAALFAGVTFLVLIIVLAWKRSP